MMNELEVLSSALKDFGFEASDETIDKFMSYSTLLIKWNKVYNLTAITKKEDVLTHHLLDCIAMIPLVKELLPNARNILDVGSGGGLPAIPLAILRPDLEICAVDAVGKKVAFINNVAIELGLKNLSALHIRVENIKDKQFDIITSRAFSSLNLFVDLTSHLISENGKWFAMKGVDPVDEIKLLPNSVKLTQNIPLLVPHLKEERRLIVLERV